MVLLIIVAALLNVQDVPLVILEECLIEGCVTNCISFSGILTFRKNFIMVQTTASFLLGAVGTWCICMQGTGGNTHVIYYTMPCKNAQS